MKTSFAPPYPFEVFDRVGYVNLLARNSRYGERVIDQTPRRPHKGAALVIFLISRLLSNEDDFGFLRALAKNSLSSVFVKITAFTGTGGLPQRFKRVMLGQKISRRLLQCNCHDFRLSFFLSHNRGFIQITEAL